MSGLTGSARLTGRTPVLLWASYAAVALVAAAAVVLAGWGFADEAGRRGLLLGVGTALVLQLLVFGLQVSQERGTPGFLGAWVAGVFLRFLAVGGVTAVLLLSEDFDPLRALLGLAGLLLVLLLLEPLWLRKRANRSTN